MFHALSNTKKEPALSKKQILSLLRLSLIVPIISLATHK